MKRSILLCSLCFFVSVSIFGQRVAINSSGTTADASAMLDISSTNTGLLIPRVMLSSAVSQSPIITPAPSLLVYNLSNGSDVTPGYYYWSGAKWVRLVDGDNPWRTTGNSLSATGIFGTLTNNSIDLYTNNTVRGRMTNLGEFFWGTVNTAQVGDLMSSVSNASFPFALNGYSSFNGAGVYGTINGGNTSFAAVQGEYASSSTGIFNTAGVRGLNQSGVAGTGFRTSSVTGPRVGVIGNTTVTNGQYTFGVHGTMGSTDIRCGGVFGDDFGLALGALAYFAANLTDYSVYGFGNAFQTGIAGGKAQGRALTTPNTHIGLGIYGGVMGGWIRGLVYGAHMKGERYGLYVDGKTYTNAPIAELITTSAAERIPAYANTSLSTEIYAKGKGMVQNGSTFIAFDKRFSSLVSDKPEDIVITVSPTTASKGLYVSQTGKDGFYVSENEPGTNPVSFNWIAMATRSDNAAQKITPELLDKNFDNIMNGVMFNDANTQDKAQPIWWDGQDIRFDNPPPKMVDNRVMHSARIRQ